MGETLHRMVAGNRVAIPADEAEIIRAEWASNAARPKPPAENMPDVRELASEVAALRVEVDALLKVAVKV